MQTKLKSNWYSLSFLAKLNLILVVKYWRISHKLLVILVACLLGSCIQNPQSATNKMDDYAINLPQNNSPKLNNGAIYQANYQLNLYSDKANYQVGDIITIVLAEKTSATKNANTKLAKNSKAGADLDQLLSAEFAAERNHQGTAQAGQGNSLNGAISVVVTKVLANKTLQVSGTKLLTLNNGDEIVTISGIIRTDDISANNQIASSKVANSKISYTGHGAFADSNKPGWLSRLLFSPWFGL